MSARRVRVESLVLPGDGAAPSGGELAAGTSAALAGLLREHGMPAPGAPPPAAVSGTGEDGGLAARLAAEVYRALGRR